MGLIVQLFNSGRQPGRSAAHGSHPDHRRGESVLTAAGFELETLAPFRWPWNPLAGRHNAYAGLDPLRALKVLLTRRDASIVCAHLESAVVVLLLRRLFRFRPRIVIWEVPWSSGWAFRDWVRRLAIPRADLCVVFGSSQVDLLHRQYGPSVRAAFIGFCIDTDFYRPLPPPDRDGYIFSCGLDAGRDFDVILRAMAGSSVPVLIKAARVPEFDQAAHPGVTILTERLSYIDYRALYAAASVVVVATRETQNASGVTALMEAMAMGKPLIVTDNPALRDYFPPPGAAIVVPVGDAAAMRAAIDAVLADPARAAAMGRKARDYAEQHFAPAVHFQAIADLFSQFSAGRAAATDRRAA